MQPRGRHRRRGPPRVWALTAFIIGTAVACALDGPATGPLLAAHGSLLHPGSILQALAYKQIRGDRGEMHIVGSLVLVAEPGAGVGAGGAGLVFGVLP